MVASRERRCGANVEPGLHERFADYRRTGNRRVHDELVETHVGLAAYLARRFFDRGEAFDELHEVALVGLFKAVERFAPERGLPFSTFAHGNEWVTAHGQPQRNG